MKLHQPSAISIWIRCQKNKTQGMTLIEFLVVAFVIVTLAAVALPSLMSCGGKCKQVEARNNIGAMNRAQQAYNIEKGAFADSFEKMGIGIKPESSNYSYFTRVNERAVFSYAIPKDPNIKSYTGAVWTETTNINGKKEETTKAILCEAEKPGATKRADTVYINGRYVCGEGTELLGS
jgi:type IV pilus assembly protein PilA